MSRISKNLAQVWCGAVIAAPLLAALLGVRADEIENRRLAEMPEFSFGAIFSEEGFGAFDDYLRDRMPGRLEAIRLDAWIDYWVFQDSPSPEVTRGKEGWLFHAHTLHLWPCHALADPVVNIESYQAFSHAAVRAGKSPLVVVSPDKASIFPEYLSDSDRAWYETCAGPRQRQLEAYMAQVGSHGVNLWKSMREEKLRLLEGAADGWQGERLRFLFRPQDRHWAIEGGRVQADSLLRRVSKVAPRLSPNRDKIENRESELSRVYLKLGLMEAYRKHPNRESHVRRTGDNDFLRYQNSKPRDPRRLVVFRDSFCNDSVEFIADHFASSVFIHWKLGPSWPASVRESLAEADVVILQTAESRRHTRIRSTAAIVKLLGSL